MNKKYEIINLRTKDDNTIFYVLYIVLIFVIVFIIYKLIYNFIPQENFYTNNYNIINKNNTSDNNYENFQTNNTIPSENITNNKSSDNKLTMESLIQQNKELTQMKDIIQEKLDKQSKAIYISQNYNKVDSSSFDDEMIFLLDDFVNTIFPQIDIDNKKIIKTNSDLESVLNQIKQMKNFYQPGDIVKKNSTFDIDKNNICYRHDGKPIKPTQDLLNKYPECMVCSVEPSDNVYNSKAWKTTKTNINKVCLFNPTAQKNSGIPNLQDCQKFCAINNNILPTKSETKKN